MLLILNLIGLLSWLGLFKCKIEFAFGLLYGLSGLSGLGGSLNIKNIIVHNVLALLLGSLLFFLCLNNGFVAFRRRLD